MTACTSITASTPGFLTTGQVARKLGKSNETVRRLIADSKIEAERAAGGHWRIPAAAYARFRTGGVIRRKPIK